MKIKIEAYKHNWKQGDPPFKTIHAQENGYVTVGRKDSDILLVDNTVSRQHLTISLRGTDQLVLENTGKVGSFVVQDPKEHLRNDKNGDGDDSATDNDEDPVAESQALSMSGIQLSATSRHLFGTKNAAILFRVPADKYFVSLSASTTNPVVIVQVGRNGSTVVISAIPTPTVYDMLTATQRKPLAKNYPQTLGWESTKDFTKATVLLTNKLSAKQPLHIAAWCRQLPCVTTDYIVAAVEADNKGEMSDFASPGDASFWTATPDPHLWSSCTLLHSDANEPICQVAASAGARVEECLDTATADRILDSTPHCFGLTGSKKFTKHLKAAGVLLLSTTAILQCVTQQRLPTDSKTKRSVGQLPLSGDMSAADSAKDNDPPALAASQVTPKRKRNEPGDTSQSSGRPTKKASRATQSPKQQPQTTATIAEGNEEEEEQPTADQKSRRGTTAMDARSTQGTKINTGDTEHESPPQEATPAEDPPPSEPTTSKQAPRNKKSKQQSVPKDDEAASTGRRRLVTLDNGWMQAAPPGAARAAYRKTRQEISGENSDDEMEDVVVAVTEVCPQLWSEFASALAKQSTPTATESPAYTGPNYSRFRKNSVVSSTFDNVSFVSVFPTNNNGSNDSDDNDDSRHKLEEQQRRADALFRDPPETNNRRSTTGRRRQVV